ncbi:MAG: glutathione peroxidase [Bacteroidales bacterium]|nr:glutathione peroxidase [Bacteroidales bacterium]
MDLYDITVIGREDNKDVEIQLGEYRNKVLLIVNTATACGLTPQYEALEFLYRKYQSQGFVVLDFPCNQFKEQAKGSDEEIGAFCSLKYDTTFPRFKKIEVNGKNESPLYTFLKNAKTKGEGRGSWLMNMLINFFSHLNGKSVKDSDIKWNFEKFLIDRKGNVVRRFSPTVKPEQLEVYIQQLLKV